MQGSGKVEQRVTVTRKGLHEEKRQVSRTKEGVMALQGARHVRW